MKIQILEEAENDLIYGYRFYETRLEGLGDYFLNTLFSDIDSLRLYAGIHPIKYGFHRLLSRRFPYAVYYCINENIVWVYAVLDCRQNPLKIHERLS